jgi:hypothetical protein
MNTIIRIAITAAALAITVCAAASETDQYFDRSKPMADSTEALNKKFNETLAKVIARHRTVRDQRVIVYKVSSRLGGHHFVDYRLKDKYEKWALKSPTVATRKVAIRDSIYGNMPPWSIRAVAVFGLGETIRVNDQLIGSDKLSRNGVTMPPSEAWLSEQYLPAVLKTLLEMTIRGSGRKIAFSER